MRLSPVRSSMITDPVPDAEQPSKIWCFGPISSPALPTQLGFTGITSSTSNGAWVEYRLPPHTYRCHNYYLDANNQAPPPSIRFDNGVGNVRTYSLGFYAANQVNFYSGKRYNFQWSWPYLDLYSR